MSEKEKLNKLDDMISDMEMFQERANAMAGILNQDYFDLNDDKFKVFYFEKASIEHDILFDYVYRTLELLRQARKLLNEGKR